jgi:hypothetical protein
LEQQITCPVCNQPVSSNVNECSRCGFKLVGQTLEFSVPGTGGIPINPTAGHGSPQLTVTKGLLEGEVFQLKPLPVVIGRDPECDLFLNNMTVSRKHAIIEQLGSKLIIRDKNSLNGTWVDGKVVDEAELVEGTLIQIGTFSMRFSS